jgi:hypothetical protein
MSPPDAFPEARRSLLHGERFYRPRRLYRQKRLEGRRPTLHSFRPMAQINVRCATDAQR